MAFRNGGEKRRRRKANRDGRPLAACEGMGEAARPLLKNEKRKNKQAAVPGKKRVPFWLRGVRMRYPERRTQRREKKSVLAEGFKGDAKMNTPQSCRVPLQGDQDEAEKRSALKAF